jgi:ribonuclease-3
LALSQLESVLGLSFRDQGLLRQALVHRSFLNEQGGSSLDSYERMEFLGDAVLELVISTELYSRLDHLSEGELTKSRAALVCRESLSQVARSMGLGDFLLLGRGEEATGGRHRETTLAAALEALVAAVYLDRGYEAARHFILRLMSGELDQVYRKGKAPESPKSQLQERFQGLGRPPPLYRLVSAEGPDHAPVFTVVVVLGDDVMGTGTGGRKSDAERAAAEDALVRLEASPGE